MPAGSAVLPSPREGAAVVGALRSKFLAATNPGRNELDENQGLFYPAIIRAIKETGYLGQDFLSRREPLTSPAAAVQLCNV